MTIERVDSRVTFGPGVAGAFPHDLLVAGLLLASKIVSAVDEFPGHDFSRFILAQVMRE